MIYKILTTQEFNSLPAPPTLWKGTAFDQSASPVALHCATSLHLPEVLSARFSAESAVWIIAMERSNPKVQSTVDWFQLEKDGEVFVRLKGAELDVISDIVLRRPVTKVDGEWDVGELLF